MLPFARPAAFYLTPASPSPVTYDHAISPKHTLNVHDVDGQGREWVVEASVSKVSIYNSKNLTLRLAGRVISSTVDVLHYAEPSLVGKIVLAPRRSETAPGYGFKNLSFQVGTRSEFVLADRDGDLYDPSQTEAVLRASEGQGQTGQWVLSFDASEDEQQPKGWKLEGLERGANDYPLL
ncbi:hypothetical protein JCM11491_005546 [Sporobolomyces phaffii]